MKQQLSVNISIPHPCHQDWANMPRVGSGLHCGECSKVVTDFTKLSDAQIIDFLKHNTLSCGVFRPDQLNRDITLPTVRKTPFGAKWLVTALCFFGWIRESAAQQKTPANSKTIQAHPIIPDKAKPLEPAKKGIHALEELTRVAMPERLIGGIPPQRVTHVINSKMESNVANPDGHRGISAPTTLSAAPASSKTTYIVEGIQLRPHEFAYTPDAASRRFWKRLRFWKKMR